MAARAWSTGTFRTSDWLLLAGAVVLAVAADLASEGPGGSGPIVYVLAALPGVIAYRAFRSLLASALVTLAPVYLLIGHLTRGRPAHTPSIALDHAIAVEPAWMIVYGSLYVFVVVLPLLVVRDWQLARRALQAYLAVMLAAYIGFILYPTLAPRPETVHGDGFAAWSLRALYSIDPPHGCFPSLHVAYSFVSALTAFRVHRSVGLAAALWAALIGVSTLYTKQHYAVDVMAGAAMALLAYVLFLRKYPREAVSDNDRRRAPLRALSVVGIFGIMVAGFWVVYRL